MTWRGLSAVLVCFAGSCGGDDPAVPDPDADVPQSVVPADPPACESAISATGFCDVTALAGIDRVHSTAANDVPAGGAALADFDGDGDLDLYLTGMYIDGAYYRNDGTGRFEEATAEVGLAGEQQQVGVTAADLDNDGDQDLVVTGWRTRVRLYENQGAGTFTEVGGTAGLGTDAHEASSAAIADYDGDGWLDVFVGVWSDTTQFDRMSAPNLLFHNTGGLSFEEVGEQAGITGGTDSWALAAAFVDMDADGDLDLHIGNDFGLSFLPDLDLRNAGDGTFELAADSGADAPIFTMSVSPADYDRDGDFDLYLANVGDNVLLRNDGTGAVQDVAAEAGVTAYGYRADDEVYNPYIPFDPESPNEAERQLAEFTDGYLHTDRTDVHVAVSWASIWLDYDHDGVLDLYVCNGLLGGGGFVPEGYRQPNIMYRGLGDGTFEEMPDSLGVGDRGIARGCARGDLDGDGDADLVVVNTGYNMEMVGGRFAILRNDAAQGHYLRVRLVGTGGNRDGIGATIHVTAGGDQQHQLISAGDTFLSSSERVAQFGLGEHTTADVVEVRWPSGDVDRLTDVAADATVTVEQGTSPP